MDFVATDIFSPPSRSSVDDSPRSARTAPSPSSSGVRKHFSAVLQRARGEEGRADRPDRREADDIQSSNTSQKKPLVNEARGRDGSSVRTDRMDRADTSSSKTSERDRPDENMNKPAQASKKDGAREDGERSTVEDDARSDSHSAETQPVSVPTPVPITTQTINQEQVPTEEDPQSSKGEHRATTASSMSAQTSPASPMPSMTASETHKDASSSDGAATQSRDQPKQTSAMPARPMENNAQAGPILKDNLQAVVGSADTKAVIADAETHAAASGQETGRSGPQSDGRPNLNSGLMPNDGGIDHSMTDAARIAEAATLARPVSSHSEGHAPARGGKDNVESKTEALLPFDNPAQSSSNDGNGESKVREALLRGHLSSFDVMKQFSELKVDQNGALHDQAQIELPQAAVVEHHVSDGQSTASIIPGTQGGVGAGPPPPPPTPFVSHAPPAVPGHDPADKSAQVMVRSVVFDVVQPDLGHVNIRVAMTNDIVHTHLSADRPEVGQFLINGQDRLQAAFQANGLDMGQFRVDIDRQSGGRSFHHGPSQEQGQTWDHGSQGTNWGQSPDRQNEQRTSLHGLLNVVA